MPKRAILLPAVVVAVLVLAAAPAPPSRRSVTVEPTLALTMDLSLEEVERGRGGSSGRLRLDLGIVDDVADLELVLRAPDGVTLEGPGTQRLAALRHGEARTVFVSFHAAGGRDRDLRVEATFRTGDGVVRTLGQGITLTAAAPAPPGRRVLGAYECQAVPLQELPR